MNAKPTTYEQIREQAIREEWTNNKARKALHAAGLDERMKELVTELRQIFNRPTGPAETAPPTPAPVVSAPAPAPQPAAPAAEVPAAPQRFEHLTIWCDAGENTIRKVVNSYGKMVTYKNGGFLAGVVIEETREELIFKNGQCSYSLEAEAFAVLKSIECAIARGAKSLLIKSDGVTSLSQEISKRENKGDRYLAVARRLVDENGLQLGFERVGSSSDANRADAFLRRHCGLPKKY